RADAADADDGAVRVHRPVPGGDLDRHRQPGATPLGDGGRRRPADRSAHVARGRAGAVHSVPWEVAMTPTRRRPAAGIHPRSLSQDTGARMAPRIEGRTTTGHGGNGTAK